MTVVRKFPATDYGIYVLQGILFQHYIHWQVIENITAIAWGLIWISYFLKHPSPWTLLVTIVVLQYLLIEAFTYVVSIWANYINMFVCILISCTVHGKIVVGKNWRIWQIMSYSPKFSSLIFTDTWKTYMAYALTVAYLPNFSSPIAYTYMLFQNFPHHMWPGLQNCEHKKLQIFSLS